MRRLSASLTVLLLALTLPCANLTSAQEPQRPATDSLKEKLVGTKWINSNKVSFEWTADGRFLHKGIEREWKVLDGKRVQIVFAPNHQDTLVFNDSFTEFKQLVKGGPASMQGSLVVSKDQERAKKTGQAPPPRPRKDSDNNLFGLSGEIRGIHDPCIIAEKGWYYIFSTGAFMHMRRSRDLRKWDYYGQVFDAMPSWTKDAIPKANDLWGGDIMFWNGKFYLYYSVCPTGQNVSPYLAGIGLATNTTLDRGSPDYKWEDQGMVIMSRPGEDDYCAIDPDVFMKNGKEPWMTFGTSHFLKLVKLGPNGKLNAGSRLVSIAQRTGPIIEAPTVVEHGGWYYVFISFDRCCQGVNSTYHIRVGRSKKLEGPYVDFEGRSLLDGGGTLLLASYGTIRGPGNNVVFLINDREYIVHHFYDGLDNGSWTLQFRPLLWGKDGWPLAGEPGFLDPDGKAEPASLAGRWRHSIDFGDEHEVTLLDGGKLTRSNANRGTWTTNGANLTLRWPDKAAPNGAWLDKCVVSPDGSWYVGRNQNGAVIRGRRID